MIILLNTNNDDVLVCIMQIHRLCLVWLLEYTSAAKIQIVNPTVFELEAAAFSFQLFQMSESRDILQLF